MTSQIVLAFAAVDDMRGAHLSLELALRVYVVASMMRDEPPRVSEFAGRRTMTPDAFTRFFEETTGRCAKDVVQTEMLWLAQAMLRTGTPIERIARARFWGTPRTFYRRFYRLTGFTPAEYQRNVARNATAEHSAPPGEV